MLQEILSILCRLLLEVLRVLGAHDWSDAPENVTQLQRDRHPPAG